MIDEILSRLDKVRGLVPGKWEARCPAHDDNNPSLGLDIGDDGRVLLYCRANCETEDVVAAIGLKMSDLMPENDGSYSRDFRRDFNPKPKRENPEWAAKSIEATEKWKSLPAADPEHPYLEAKQVRPYGIRQDGDNLVIPMRIGRVTYSLQYIAPDGIKKFLPGGRTKGAYFAIGPKPETHIWIAEGYATAASVHEISGKPVACAFSGPNMLPVTKYLKSPDYEIYIAADNDNSNKEKEKNPGWAFAGDCLNLGAEFRVAPDFNGRTLDSGKDPSDWNDYCCLYGKAQAYEEMYGY